MVLVITGTDWSVISYKYKLFGIDVFAIRWRRRMSGNSIYNGASHRPIVNNIVRM